ncbi:MAG: winged helix-turn-helix transcriptional regulator [Nitrosopumilaceae archaeon]|nr:winged helix-turn-helix transcriptional regulator [Nitrosopumilaceae archaeon]
MTDKSDTILEAIESNPGIHFRGIMRKTGLMNGVLSYHLAKLERNNLIIARRRPRTARFYSVRIPESDHAVIRALRRPTPRALLIALLHEDPENENGLSFVELVKRAERSPSTVSLYLSQLVRESLVDMRPANFKKHYQLRDRERIDRLLEDHDPSLVGRYASNFEDMINPLGSS